MPPSMDELSKLGECLSDRIGIRILALLREGELCVCEIKAALEEDRSKVDLRLRRLMQSGVVRSRIRGRWTAFRIQTKFTDLIETLFEAFEDETEWDPDLQQDRRRLKAALSKRVNGWCANPRSRAGNRTDGVLGSPKAKT